MDSVKKRAFLEETKTAAGHLTEFGSDLVELCRRYDIQQAAVAAALDVSPAVISRRYAQPKPIAGE